jgi:hypothetical protein
VFQLVRGAKTAEATAEDYDSMPIFHACEVSPLLDALMVKQTPEWRIW